MDMDLRAIVDAAAALNARCACGCGRYRRRRYLGIVCEGCGSEVSDLGGNAERAERTRLAAALRKATEGMDRRTAQMLEMTVLDDHSEEMVAVTLNLPRQRVHAVLAQVGAAETART